MDEPIASASICFSPVQQHTLKTCVETDNQGMYLVALLPGTYSITASHPLYHPLTKIQTIADKEAKELNFILQDKQKLSDDDSIAYIIEQGANAGTIGAYIHVSQGQITYFKDLTIDITSTPNIVTCTVSADDGPGTIVSLYLGDYFDLSKDLTYTIDGDTLERMELSEFLDGDPTINSWAATEDGLILARIGHFSTHIIVISAVSILLDFIPLASVYVCTSIFLALGAFIIPIVSWKKHFKKVKEK
jgi:hypothetical protein